MSAVTNFPRWSKHLLGYGVGLSVVMVICAVVFPSGVMAEEVPSEEHQQFGDWSVRCVEREALPPCDIVQFATHRDSGQQVMHFSIAHAGRQNAYGVQIKLPLGVLLSGGVAVQIEEDAPMTDFKFTRCDESGCFIERIMYPDDMRPFEGGGEGILAVIGREGQPMALPISFNGFNEALGEMTVRNRKWAGRY